MRNYTNLIGIWRQQTKWAKCLTDFRLDFADSDKDQVIWDESKSKSIPILLNEEESLKRKQKGMRISYWERVYLYSLMKQGKKSKSSLTIDFNLSLSTLYSILNEFDNASHKLGIENFSSSRNIVESPKIQNAVRTYLCITKTPWTAKNIVMYLKTKLGISISERIVRIILSKKLGMRYKKGLSRLVNFDEAKQHLAKQWFSIKLWKVIERFRVLINVDQSSFSRLTKKDYSWIPKGKSQIIKNIWFKNSCSLITAITSTGAVIAAKINTTVTSNLMVSFMKELISFINTSEGLEAQSCLVILDNATIHHARIVKDYMKNERLNIAFIPPYSPEIAPVEHYFSKLKQVVIDKARGRWIGWRSEEGNCLLKDSITSIRPELICSIWTSFTQEVYRCLDLC